MLQNYILPTLKKYSADIPMLLSFQKMSKSKLSTIQAHSDAWGVVCIIGLWIFPRQKLRVNMFPNNMIFCPLRFRNFTNEFIKYYKLLPKFGHK